MANALYGKLEYTLYGIVLVVSASLGVLTERLDFQLQKQTLAAEMANLNQDFSHRLEAELAQLLASANGLAATVAMNVDIDAKGFNAAAVRLGTDRSTVLRISLATDGIVRHLYPEEQASLLIGKDLRTLPNYVEGVELARQSGKPVLLGPLDLVDGGRGLILRLAFAPDLDDRGPASRRHMVSIVVDDAAFFDKHSKNQDNPEIVTAVSRLADGAGIWGDASRLSPQPVVQTVATPSGIWQIASTPSAGWPILSSRAPTIAGLAVIRILIVCAVLRIILGRIRLQKAAERQLTDAIEALDDGFAVFDPEDRLILSNGRYREIYRKSSDLLFHGAKFEDILRGGVARGQYPDAIGREEQWISNRLASHRAGGSVVEQKLDNGRWVRVVERRTGDGSIVGFRVDITELKAAVEAARAAERAKSDYIAVLSHELRTPLTINMGYTSLLAEASNLPALKELQSSITGRALPHAAAHVQAAISTIEDMAAKAHRSSSQLLALMNHLLDFSRIEAGKMQCETANIEVAEILADIESLFRAAVEAKGLGFHLSGVAAWVRADPIRVRQILTNLVSNALKFTDEGQITVRVSIREEMARFEVRDTGCGIREEMSGRLFSPFEQADSSSTRRAKGTGLGLTISKNLAEMMGGEIGFESSLHSGSLFWFTVPLARGEVDQHAVTGPLRHH